MNGKCPTCGTAAPLAVFAVTDDARDAVVIAGEMPPRLFRLVMQYISLFRPLGEADMPYWRVVDIMRDLAGQIKTQCVSYKGRSWSTTTAMWAEALTYMQQQRKAKALKLPLESHGYLYSVVAGRAERAETKSESQRETQRQHGGYDRGDGGLQGIGGAIEKVLSNQTPEGRHSGIAAMRAALTTGDGNGTQTD